MLIENGFKLYTGQISFIIFSLFGLWKPLNWKWQWITWLYHIYSIIMIIFYIIFTFSVLMYLIRVSENTDSFTENLYNFLAILNVFVKQISIMIKRKAIIELKEKLGYKLCQPRDLHEFKILQKRSELCRSNVVTFLTLFCATAVVAVVSPFTNAQKITLPLSGWYPYTMESRASFYLTYLLHSVCLIMAASTSASVEGLATTFILQICAQLEIIFHRLELLPNFCTNDDPLSDVYHREKMLIKDCTKHHMHIYSLGEQLNNVFQLVIFVQFCTSMISLCALIYQVSRLSFYNPTFWLMIASMGCVTVQNYLYCSYGEKLIRKSTAVANAVQQMNWVTLTNRAKRDILILMTRASLPMKLTGSSLVVMSIKTFVTIMKSAYSAYNLLKNSY